MKTLADRLVKSGGVFEVEGQIARLLRRPARNHSDAWAPMVERFIFDAADYDAFVDAASPHEKRAAAYHSLRAPMPCFWAEIGEAGFFFDGETVFCLGGGKRGVYHAASVSLDALRGMSGDRIVIATTKFGETLDKSFLGSCFTLFVFMCAAINSPRACTRERIVPGRDLSLTRRLMERRKAQRAPLYSFNKMTLNRPDTSVQSSGSVLCGAQTSKRGHWVIGHWRLIEGNAEPYWTWIESHKRGDDDLGFVAHERNVRLAPGSFGTRRGFVIPHEPGQRGEKRPAEVPK